MSEDDVEPRQFVFFELDTGTRVVVAQSDIEGAQKFIAATRDEILNAEDGTFWTSPTKLTSVRYSSIVAVGTYTRKRPDEWISAEPTDPDDTGSGRRRGGRVWVPD